MVFAETGLLAGFFLPGDSLLFTAGLLTATGFITMPVALLAGVVSLAAFAGDQVGFAIGRRAGPRVFTRPGSRLFRREYVDKTTTFFTRFGGRAIVLARFVPRSLPASGRCGTGSSWPTTRSVRSCGAPG